MKKHEKEMLFGRILQLLGVAFIIAAFTMGSVRADPQPSAAVGIYFDASKISEKCPAPELMKYAIQQGEEDGDQYRIILIFKCARPA